MNEHVTFERIELSEIPPQRANPRYATIVTEFLESGEQAVRLNLWEGATTSAAYGGLRNAIKSNGFAVSVKTRKGQVFLVRN